MERTLARWSLGHAVAMLAGGCAVVAGAPRGSLVLLAVLSFGVLLAAGRGRFTPAGDFGAANTLTSLRLLVILVLSLVPRDVGAGPVGACVLAAVFTLDGFDGWLARRRGESSAFGARFDMEVDAVTVLVCALLLFAVERAGGLPLAVGAMRYVYVLAVAQLSRGAESPISEAPASRLGRYAFSLMVLGLVARLWPLPLSGPLLDLASIAVLLSFARSLAQLRRR